MGELYCYDCNAQVRTCFKDLDLIKVYAANINTDYMLAHISVNLA